jgi:hypothetical protein
MDEEPRSTGRKSRSSSRPAKLPKGWQSPVRVGAAQRRRPVNWRGHKFTVSFGIPLTQGLNEVPGAAGKGQADEYFKTAMSLVTPVVKNPIEYFNNYSFFFRDQIERDDSPLVSAPSYVSKLSDGTRKDLGIVRGLDKRTGKIIWRWPGKLDYIVKTVPGLPQYAQQLATEGTNRRGKGTGGKLLQVMGVRAEPFDPDRTITNLAYERISEIDKRQAALRQSVNPKNNLPVSAKNPTPEYIKLSQQLKIAQQITYQGQKAQDYKVLPKLGAPAKARGGSSGRVKIPGVGGTGEGARCRRADQGSLADREPDAQRAPHGGELHGGGEGEHPVFRERRPRRPCGDAEQQSGPDEQARELVHASNVLPLGEESNARL